MTLMHAKKLKKKKKKIRLHLVPSEYVLANIAYDEHVSNCLTCEQTAKDSAQYRYSDVNKVKETPDNQHGEQPCLLINSDCSKYLSFSVSYWDIRRAKFFNLP